MIYILSGDIRSGKTTALLDWIKNRKDIDGLLCPDGVNGKRYFLKIKSKTEFEIEVEAESEDTITIGPFHFLKSAFKDANDYLIVTNIKRDFKYLIIDEIGKLELKNEGLHDAAKVLISEFINNTEEHLILVVRFSLLEEVIRHYSISNYTILKKEDLKSLN